MVALYAFDAANPPPPATVKAHGIAMSCYMTGDFGMSPAQVSAYRKAGLGLWPNYENALWELVSDRAAGQAAGRKSIPQAKACGFPRGTWYPHSVDVDVPPALYPKVAAAFDGINDINQGYYRIGVYGQGGLIDYLHDHGKTQGKGWLSMSSGFPGFNPRSGNVSVVQGHALAATPSNPMWLPNPIAGTDINLITDVINLGAWWPEDSPYNPGTNPVLGDDPMIIVQAPKAGTGALCAQGIYLYDGTQWGTIAAVRKALGSLADTLLPVVKITDAEFTALPQLRDDMLQILVPIQNVADQVAAVLAAVKAQTGVELTPVQIAAIAAAIKPGPLAISLTGQALPSAAKLSEGPMQAGRSVAPGGPVE